MIDYHCHILPGIDDGATDLDESLEMARVLAAVGFREIHCTPHCIKGAYDTMPELVLRKTDELQIALDSSNIALKIMHGMEYHIDEFLLGILGDAASLKANVLIEAPFQSEIGLITNMLTIVVNHGFHPIIAHPERNKAFADSVNGKEQRHGYLTFLFSLFGNGRSGLDESPDTSIIAELKRIGCRFQGNIGSFAGFYGEKVRRNAIRFLEMGVYSCLGSDAHRIDQLEDMLLRGIASVEQSVGKEEAHRLLSCRL